VTVPAFALRLEFADVVVVGLDVAEFVVVGLAIAKFVVVVFESDGDEFVGLDVVVRLEVGVVVVAVDSGVLEVLSAHQ
jgi:hypothetical protein